MLHALNYDTNINIRDKLTDVLGKHFNFVRLISIYNKGAPLDLFTKFKDHFNFTNITLLDVYIKKYFYRNKQVSTKRQ